MSCASSTSLHETIMKYNVLEKIEKWAQNYLPNHVTLYKVAFLVNHLFRAVGMAIFMKHLPFHWGVNLSICFGGSLFYRLTVEWNCAYKFALPAFAGAVAFPFAQAAFIKLLSGVAFSNLVMFATSVLYLVPITAYITYVILTVDYDVNIKCGII